MESHPISSQERNDSSSTGAVEATMRASGPGRGRVRQVSILVGLDYVLRMISVLSVDSTRSVAFTDIALHPNGKLEFCHEEVCRVADNIGPLGTDPITLHEFGHGAGWSHIPYGGSQFWADLVQVRILVGLGE